MKLLFATVLALLTATAWGQDQGRVARLDIRLSEVRKFYQACMLSGDGWEMAGSRRVNHLTFALTVLRVQSDPKNEITSLWKIVTRRSSDAKPPYLSGGWIRRDDGTMWTEVRPDHTFDGPGIWSSSVDVPQSVGLLRDIAAGLAAPILVGVRFEDEETDRVYRVLPAFRAADLRTLKACLQRLLPS